MKHFKIIIIFTTILLSNRVFALCSDGRQLSIQKEFFSSDIVAIGTVLAEKKIFSPDDPEGFEKTIYTFEIIEFLKGKKSNDFIELVSKNTSSRFSMSLGVKYLAFIKKDGERGFIDNCGNSGEAQNRLKEIKILKK